MARLIHSLSLGVALGLISGVALADSSASRYYEDAQQRFENRDSAGAIIQLKNAIQQDRQMLAAHLLLGRVLLSEGDAQGAEVAFEEALRLGVSRAEVAVPLGQAYLLQGKYERLLDRLAPSGMPPAIQAEVLVLRSSAHLERGNLSAAMRSLDEAQALVPGSLMVQLARVNALMRTGQLQTAAPLIDELIRRGTVEPAVWDAKASLLHMRGDVSGALQSYDKSLTLRPDNIDTRIARAGLLLDIGKLDEALLDIRGVQKASPREPRAAYLKALIAGRRGDVAQVKASLSDVVRLIDPVPASVLAANKQQLMLGAMSHYGLGNFEKARDYLNNYVRLYPKESGPAKVLASIHLQMKAHRQAASLLEPFYKAGTADAKALSMLAGAYMALRQYNSATEVLERSVSLSGGAPEARAELGLGLMGMGQREQGMEQFQQAFAKDPGNVQAGVALTVLYMKQQQLKKALVTISEVVKRHPDNLAAIALLGAVRSSSGDLVGARKAYDEILAKSPLYVAAILNLAKIDMAEDKLDAAQGRLSQVLKSAPKNTDAMFEMAALDERRRNLPAAISWLEKARAQGSGGQRAAIYLVDLHLRNRNPDQALIVAKDLVLQAPENINTLRALAKAQLAIGDGEATRNTLSTMSRLAGYDASAQVDIAYLQYAAANVAGALHSLEKALSSAPDHQLAMVLQIEILIAKKEFGKAEALIGSLAKKPDGSAKAMRLQGDLDLGRGNFGAAIGNYRNALGKTPSSDIALRVYRAHLAQGEAQKGLAFLESWFRQNPTETSVQRVLADGQLRAGNLGAARTGYERLLSKQPDEPELLNNLAQVLLKQGDKGAIGLAERAVRAAPADSAYLDTLGWVLVHQGQLDKGIAYLRDARLRNPSDPEVRYHLAVALNKLGRPREAKEELGQALQSGQSFDGVDDARRLERQLSGS